MKFKKLFIFISIFVLSLLMVTSCNKENKENGNQNNGGDEPLVNEGLSKEQFVGLLFNQSSNYTMITKQSMDTAEITITLKVDAKYNGEEITSLKASLENSSGFINLYYELKDGEFYVIYQDTQSGSIHAMAADEFDISAIDSLASTINLETIKDFSYNKETDTYQFLVEAEDEEQIRLECTVKNGYITHITVTNGEVKAEVEYSKFGTTVVRIPDYTIEGEGGETEVEGEAITSDEFAGIVGGFYDNYTVEYTDNAYTMKILFDATTTYKQATIQTTAVMDVETYFVEIEGKFYQITMVTGAPLTVEEMDNFEENNLVQELCSQLSEFTLPEFDEETGEYHFVMNEGTTDESVINVKFADGKIVYLSVDDTTLVIYDYGTTVVEIPDFNLPDENASFADLFNKVEENYSANISVQTEGNITRAAINFDGSLVDGDIVYAEIQISYLGTIQYGMLYENNLYEIENIDGEWIAKENAGIFELFNLKDSLSEFASQFVYDEAKDEYLLELVELSAIVTVSDDHIESLMIITNDSTVTVTFLNFGQTEVELPVYSFEE